MSRSERCRGSRGANLPQLRDHLLGTVTRPVQTLHGRLLSAALEARSLEGVDLFSAPLPPGRTRTPGIARSRLAVLSGRTHIARSRHASDGAGARRTRSTSTKLRRLAARLRHRLQPTPPSVAPKMAFAPILGLTDMSEWNSRHLPAAWRCKPAQLKEWALRPQSGMQTVRRYNPEHHQRGAYCRSIESTSQRSRSDRSPASWPIAERSPHPIRYRRWDARSCQVAMANQVVPPKLT